MVVILGLIILIAAVVVGVAGALTNNGSGHEVTGGFSVFGNGVTGSTGTLFLSGIVVGAAALFGLWLAWAGVRHRRGSVSRREPTQSPRDTASTRRDRDDLAGLREPARGENANARENPPRGDLAPAPDGRRRRRLHLFGHRPAPR